ncbi:hypothetical protein Cs7R123_14780 [Catellatospora sp. TT07R-123]|uniref:hypothetical protein n=1 Tax=Catellatospora sp. TT07R-123 TaxID=2733863 RepID=UPI001AFFA98D|nr:hypothetical protein [Catellatospora sp. TT07R-123]GHJ44136.1 hypothetical protein Cs7R123_14780 [Catellatospora sp. TT07R-123]
MKTIRTVLTTVGLLAAAAAVPTAPAHAAVSPRYTIENLGVLSTSAYAVSEARAINNAGVVVGSTTTASGATHGFRYAGGVMTDLGTLPGGGGSYANAVNDAGQIAGTADRSNGGYGYPVRWSATGAITDLGGSITNRLGVGNGIDPTGRVVGGQRGAQSEDGPNAMLYELNGTTVDLGNPPDSLGPATGINARGQVVGWPAFVWQNGTLRHLPSLSGNTEYGAGAYAISIRGVAVGESEVAGTFNTHAVAWDPTGVVSDLGTVDGIQYSQATGVNAAGEVVGTADPKCQPCVAPRAWLWRSGAGMVALDTLLPAGTGWKLERAYGVNDRGQIVGSGRLNGGMTRAFLLTPAVTVSVNFQPASAPTPAGYVADTGALFDTRWGYTYGWHADDTAATRDRNAAVSWDQRYDTVIHAAQPTKANYWELYVPNGTYVVHVVAGDPSYTDSVYALLAEGNVIASGTPTAAARWIDGTAVVTVTDNHLTISNAASSNNNKLNYIDVHTY